MSMRDLKLAIAFSMLLGATVPAYAAELETASGTVEQLTRVDTLGAEADPLLLMQFTDGRHFFFPGIEHLPAGGGVKVEVDYLPTDDDGEIPEACGARLLGVPIEVDGEEQIQTARRPVTIFASESEDCL